MKKESIKKFGRPMKRLTEEEGRKLLKALFTKAGYKVVEDYHFIKGDIDVRIDGWDPERRVGYEYMTREGGDRDDFSDPEIGKLVNRHEAGELSLLLIDGDGNPDEEILTYLARQFLAELSGADETQPF